ncbi:hypothetical protein BO99DRAFT_406233 [Aspergillus violaceofuscus CBS 115571]|uniref:HNH nuclease domain-containing protein n=1 Tax=Aspergillus violaceofuscus (strain CBS 115571) TaxID=1450538 RepID=A0A2V5HT14_ASPV1|nr:hypothetical protein BO99DRAFT_406233 [Aspergillus violaceofuscus CBS 115571]
MASSSSSERSASTAARVTARLDKYQPRGDDDDTAHFLQVVYTYLPVDGRNILASNIVSLNDTELFQFQKHIETALLRPMKVVGGKTPAIEPSPCSGVSDSVEDLLSEDYSSSNRRQSQLRRSCLSRDNHRCVITGMWDSDYKDRPADENATSLEAAHIVPFGLGTFRDGERRSNATIWQCIYRYFPVVRRFFHQPEEDINRLDNVMMLNPMIHKEFGRFALILEETDISDRYRPKIFPNFKEGYMRIHIPQFVIIESHDANQPAINKDLLALHAAVGNILHASGRGEAIEQILEYMEEGGGDIIARDGSTNIEELLSLTSLSLLATNSTHLAPPVEDKNIRKFKAGFSGAENAPLNFANQ